MGRFCELQACPCSFQVSPSALAPAKVTAVSTTEHTPDAPPPSVLGVSPGQMHTGKVVRTCECFFIIFYTVIYVYV